MAVRVNKFYETKLEVGIEKLIEKISFYLNVRDDKLLVNTGNSGVFVLILQLLFLQTVALNGFAVYFKIDPLLMGEKIIRSTETVLNLVNLNVLPDDFVANLLLESSGYYYKSLNSDIKMK